MDIAPLLERLGLDGTLKQMGQNAALGAAVAATVAASGVAPDDLDKARAALLCSIAAGVPENRAPRRELLARYVGERKLTTPQQVNAAIDFVKKKTPDAAIDAAEFEAACGAGVSFTDEQIKAKVRPHIGCAVHGKRLWALRLFSGSIVLTAVADAVPT
jgi:hypothetical protein